jgi:hypothetical protein
MGFSLEALRQAQLGLKLVPSSSTLLRSATCHNAAFLSAMCRFLIGAGCACSRLQREGCERPFAIFGKSCFARW